MKIKISKSDLNDKINLVLKAVASKGTMPILEYILLTADNGGFKMISNDLKLAIETNYIDCEIEEMGIIALEAKYFAEIVRKLPEGMLTLETNENDVKITSGKVVINFKGLLGDDFPSIPTVEETNALTLNTEDFINLVKRTVFSIAQDDAKPVLTGELFEISESILKVVAVDGFRISYGMKELENVQDFSVIIPGKALKEVSKILPLEKDSKVKMIFGESFIKFVTEKCTVVARLLDGEFIKFNQLFTESHKTKVTCKRNDLKEALERTMLVSRDTKRTPVKLEINENAIVMTSNTESGNFYEEISSLFEGETLTIGFNPKYILDIIDALESDEIVLTFTNHLSPCIIRGINDNDFKYLVLPLRI